MSNVRLAPIDAMKGFATFLVIMGHVLCLSFEACDSVVFEVLSMVHMPIFVMLSGYFSTKALPLSCRGIANYWWAKVLRLLLPLVAIPVLFQYCKFGMLGLPTVALLNGYWFTYALFIMFVPFFVFRLVTDLAKRRATQKYHFYIDLVVALLSILVVELVFLSFQGSWDSRLQGQEVSWLYKYLVLGYFVGSYGGGGDSPLKGDAVGVISGLLLPLFVLLHYYLGVEFVYGVPFWHIQTPIAVSAVCYCFYVAHRLTDTTQVLSRAVVYLGRYSLPIYLTHYLFLPSLGHLKPYFVDTLASYTRIDLLVAVLGTLWVLVPTLIVVRWVSSNKYLALILYGEPLPRNAKSAVH